MTLSQSDMLDAAYDFEVSVAMTGTSGTDTVSARDMLTNGKWRYWLEGSVCTAIIIEDTDHGRAYDQGAGIDGGTDCLHPIIEAWFYPAVGLTPARVEVAVCMENCWVSSTASKSMRDVSYSLAIDRGYASPVSAYTQSTFLHVGGMRWQKRFWVSAQPPSVRIDHNLSYLVTTKAIPNYDTSLTVSPTLVTTKYNNYNDVSHVIGGDGVDLGSYAYALSGTGAHDWIGWMPTWECVYLYSFDANLWQAVLGNADLGNNIPIHFVREADSGAGSGGRFNNASEASPVETLGRVFSVNARVTSSCVQFDQYTNALDHINTGTISYGDWTFGNTGRDHMPSTAYIAYLLTGKHNFLEQLQMEAAFCIASKSGDVTANLSHVGAFGFFNDDSPVLDTAGQLRSNAWAYRTTSQAAFLSPDSTPEQTYFIDKLCNNIAKDEGHMWLPLSIPGYGAAYDWGYGKPASATGASPLGIWCNGSVGYGPPASYLVNADTVRKAVASFQTDFMIWALGQAAEFGYKTEGLLRYMTKWYVNMILNPASSPYLIDDMAWATVYLDNTFIPTWPLLIDEMVIGGSWNPVNGNVDQGYQILAYMVLGYLWRYNADGYEGDDAWSWYDTNRPVTKAMQQTTSPKCAILPRTSEARMASQTENTWTVRCDSGSRPNSTRLAFSGVAVCPGKLFLFEGGHSDYYGNDPWIFNTVTMTWTQLYASDYTGSTNQAVLEASVDGVNYPGSISLTPITNPHPYHPIGRHTYRSMVYDPTVGRVMMGGSALDGATGGAGLLLYQSWGYPAADHATYEWYNYPGDRWSIDPDGSVWTYHAPAGGWKVTDGTNKWHYSVFNVRDGCVWLMTTARKLYRWDVSAGNTWEYATVCPYTWYGDGNLEYNPHDGCIYCLMDNAGTGIVYKCNISSATPASVGTPVWSVVTLSSGAFPTGDGCGIAYDTRNKVFLLYGPDGLFLFDPVALTCAEVTPDNTPPTDPYSGSKVVGNWQYDPENNVFWYIEAYPNSATYAKVWTYRYK